MRSSPESLAASLQTCQCAGRDTVGSTGELEPWLDFARAFSRPYRHSPHDGCTRMRTAITRAEPCVDRKTSCLLYCLHDLLQRFYLPGRRTVVGYSSNIFGPACVCEAVTSKYEIPVEHRTSARRRSNEAFPKQRPRSSVTSARRVLPASSTKARASSGSSVPVESRSS